MAKKKPKTEEWTLFPADMNYPAVGDIIAFEKDIRATRENYSHMSEEWIKDELRSRLWIRKSENSYTNVVFGGTYSALHDIHRRIDVGQEWAFYDENANRL